MRDNPDDGPTFGIAGRTLQWVTGKSGVSSALSPLENSPRWLAPVTIRIPVRRETAVREAGPSCTFGVFPATRPTARSQMHTFPATWARCRTPASIGQVQGFEQRMDFRLMEANVRMNRISRTSGTTLRNWSGMQGEMPASSNRPKSEPRPSRLACSDGEASLRIRHLETIGWGRSQSIAILNKFSR